MDFPLFSVVFFDSASYNQENERNVMPVSAMPGVGMNEQPAGNVSPLSFLTAETVKTDF